MFNGRRDIADREVNEMIDKNVEWYTNTIKHELEKLKETKFMGDLQIKLHLKDGNIGHMYFTQNKSIKKPVHLNKLVAE